MLEENLELPPDRNAGDHDEKADSELLRAIREKQTHAWETLIEKYQGRLLNFAISKLHQQADAEDVIQDTFFSFIKGLDNYRGEGNLETYLFAILRNKIIDRYRSRNIRSVSLIQDVYYDSQDSNTTYPIKQVPAVSSSESCIVSQLEHRQLQQKILSEALFKLCQSFKRSLKFRNLQILELLLYCGVSTTIAAELLKIEEPIVRVFKHRCLKQLHQYIEKENVPADFPYANIENLLTETWESQRLTCPKRSTIGAFLLEQLEPEWFHYIDFHLTTLGCHFCRANFKDLKQQQTLEEKLFRERIMASTVGFFNHQ